MAKIHVIISKRTVVVETFGFAGDACLKATEKLKRALGGTSIEQRPTDEMWATPEADTSTEVQ